MDEQYGMNIDGTPMVSAVMPNPDFLMNNSSNSIIEQTINKSLPKSSARPIIVDETTSNLAEIQSFPRISKGGRFHVHQDPVTGQRYRMENSLHEQIPEILRLRENSSINSDYTDIFISTFNEVQGATVLSEIFGNIRNNITEAAPFTRQVESTSQENFTPAKIQDYSLETYVPVYTNNEFSNPIYSDPIFQNSYIDSQNQQNIFETSTTSVRTNMFIDNERPNKRPANKISLPFQMTVNTVESFGVSSLNRPMNKIFTIKQVMMIEPINIQAISNRPLNRIAKSNDAVFTVLEKNRNIPMNKIGGF